MDYSRFSGSLPTQDSVVYELSMVVAHVREGWMDAPGNLVVHIRVSPFYHRRKKVSPELKIHFLLLANYSAFVLDPSEVPVVPFQ